MLQTYLGAACFQVSGRVFGYLLYVFSFFVGLAYIARMSAAICFSSVYVLYVSIFLNY